MASRHGTIIEAIEDLGLATDQLKTSEDWQRWLVACSRLASYSFNNVMLLYMQWERRRAEESSLPPLRAVQGYRMWSKLGRQVRRGERGLKILAPITVKKLDEQDGQWKPRLVGFKTAHVFELSQTTGRPIEMTWPTPQSCPPGLYSHLAWVCRDGGIELVDDPLLPDVARPAEVRGWFDPAWAGGKGRDKITIDGRLSDEAKVSTLLHELGHTHDPAMANLEASRTSSRTEKELVAESVAFIVGSMLGVEMSDEATHYLASWDGGTAELLAVASRIDKATKGTCFLLAPVFEEQTGQEAIAS